VRTPRALDIDRIAVRVLLLITQHADRPCPTRDQIIAQTGLPKRHVWRFLEEMCRRGMIDIEDRAIRPGNRRRMRVAGGAWTDWTTRQVRRRGFPAEPVERSP
jgi:hypothetical protein